MRGRVVNDVRGMHSRVKLNYFKLILISYLSMPIIKCCSYKLSLIHSKQPLFVFTGDEIHHFITVLLSQTSLPKHFRQNRLLHVKTRVN